MVNLMKLHVWEQSFLKPSWYYLICFSECFIKTIILIAGSQLRRSLPKTLHSLNLEGTALQLCGNWIMEYLFNSHSVLIFSKKFQIGNSEDLNLMLKNLLINVHDIFWYQIQDVSGCSWQNTIADYVLYSNT